MNTQIHATMNSRRPLDKKLRSNLDTAVVKAREVAERAAAQALTRLGVGDAKAADYLTDEQKRLRNRLRAHGRQLGDIKQSNGQQGIGHLITEVAYEHWHRMLFARFLEQNQLLMYDPHTALTLAECNELVQEPDIARDEQEARCTSGWALAGVLASKMLPQIFRIDSPVFELELAPEHQRSLEQLVTGLDLDTFQAQDSLGWVYQFWQSKRKKEVNDSGVKIGADELSPVTQLFTEPYMVSFLLDNSLGAWWAGQRLSETDWQHAASEQELRDKAAIPGVPLSYLRFVKTPSPLGGEGRGEGESAQWQPASGTFDAWPKRLSELKTLDPCCGSGHFLVAAFLMLVPMRMTLESLSPQEAIDRVLSENLHGLELDQRCVELAAFAVALEAWRYPHAGGYRSLPELNIACSGLSISSKKEEWLALAGDNANLRIALEQLYKQFKDAPALGSLINPEASLDKGSLFELKWEDVGPLLAKALAGENDVEKSELSVVALGLSKVAEILTQKFTFIPTNVPYKNKGGLALNIQKYIEKNHSKAKSALETAFMDRCIDMLDKCGSVALVLPQNWLFLGSYKEFRRELLESYKWNFLCWLGGGAFSTPLDVSPVLISLTNSGGADNFPSLDVSTTESIENKYQDLISCEINFLDPREQLKNPDHRVTHLSVAQDGLLGEYSQCYQGLRTGDKDRFVLHHWEVSEFRHCWDFFQEPNSNGNFFGGMKCILLWEQGAGELHRYATDNRHKLHDMHESGNLAWKKMGIAINEQGLKSSAYLGEKFDASVTVIFPEEKSTIAPLWVYSISEDFYNNVRKLDRKRSVTNATFRKIPFDLDHWTKVAQEQYPNGLPQPYSNDPTQWIFHGHPCGSVIWDEQKKWTAEGELRVDDTVLQVAVARLLGYRWPAELDDKMELAEQMLHWLGESDKLQAHADDDGIVCLPAVRGEKAADIRLEALLQDAYGKEWTTPLKQRLLETVGSKSLSLWLRDKFFEQHFKLFQHRPFIWHVWDGLKDGFSALVNYHKLDKAGLERLIYTYLGDWIRTQQSAMANGEDGADVRLAAAETLKKELEAILEGEAPYDIFVRWKPLAEQPIGWEPDLNDGVRLNIRPFMTAKDLGKKGAGILRAKPNIKWTKDRGKDVESAPWYSLGLEYGESEGARINDHHLTLVEKKVGRQP